MSGLMGSQTRNEYQYEPLATDEIRLIVLQPGLPGDPLSLRFEHTVLKPRPDASSRRRLTLRELQGTLRNGWKVLESLDGQYFFYRGAMKANRTQHPNPRLEPSLYAPLSELETWSEPNFEALSYVWGSSEMATKIFIMEGNSCLGMLRIGKNLSSALNHLRYRETPRTLWVDAICINQQDINERSEQVKRMSLLYSSACRVVVWLGEGNREEQHAISMLRYIGAQIEPTKDRYVLASANSVEPSRTRSESEIPLSRKVWRAIANIYERPWWFRVWTLQEILLANSMAVLQCGHEKILFTTFRKATLCLDMNERVPWMVKIAINLAAVTNLRPALDFMQLISISNARDCSDPKDKIYGILGLCSAQFASKIRPQYSRSIGQVYEEAFRAHVESSNRLDALLFSNHASVVSEFPSWVPDWNASKRETVAIDIRWKASLQSMAHRRYIEPNGLEVIGVRCGMIRHHTKPFPPDRSKLISAIAQWRPKNFRGSDSQLTWRYYEALRMGNYVDHHPEALGMPTESEWSRRCYGGVAEALDTLPASRLTAFHGSVGFSTSKSEIGFGPSQTQLGDIVFVVLGCCVPLVLRPSATGAFTIVGPCYAQDLMNGEALLGRLPEPWIAQIRRTEADGDPHVVYFNKNSKTMMFTANDPRLDALPDGWRRLGTTPQFWNEYTGEVIDYDPRLTPDMLKRRGIKLETIQLG